MSATSYLKNASLPTIDELLAHTGLRRAPSLSSRVLGSAGLIGVGALVGAGLALWLGSPRTRQQLSHAFTSGIDQASAKIGAALDPSPVSNGSGVVVAPRTR